MKEFIKEIITAMKGIEIQDVLDILLVSLVLYYIYKFIRKRGVDKLALGVIVLFILQFICTRLGLQSMEFILQNIFQVGLIAIFIIFQPEMRQGLEKMGGEPLKNIRSITRDNNAYGKMLDQIAASVADLSAAKTGALIVIERDMKNDNLYSNGTVIDSEVSRNLLNTIFFKLTALHDGAVVIRDCRIYSAACCLPLSTNENGQEAAHTRHLAAIGTSERSDAVVVVVSEETGRISLAIDGRFERFANAQALKARLIEVFIGNINTDRKKNKKSKKSKNDE